MILEVLCITLLVNNLPYQKRKLVSFGNAISGRFFKTKYDLSSYFHLKDENKVIVDYNTFLMSSLYKNKTYNDSSVIIDTNLWDYKFIPANVIDNNIYNANNFLVIDKGRKDGIKKDMGVVCENGIVGKIANVSNNYSSVISMLHSYSAISARFKDNQHLANVIWGNRDYRFGILKDIPLHLNPKKGDTIITSGFSNIFPADIMIGTIEEMIESNSKDFNTAKIRFSTNFSTLRHVYIIDNLNLIEIDSLISNNK